MSITRALEKLESLQPFTDTEAWNLFRLAAISEAAGWSLLISGILFKRFITPINNDSVLIAGQIHGTIFFAYIVAVAVLYSSLGWSRKRTIVAGLASIPPYGSLIFEQWAAYKRRGKALKTYREIVVRTIIVEGNCVLAIQPKDSGFWQLPGGIVASGKTAEQALEDFVIAQTGVTPQLGRLVYILQYRHKATERLEMFFSVSNGTGFEEAALKAKLESSSELDDIGYIYPEGNKSLQPVFLQTEPIVATSIQQTSQVVFVNPVK